MIDAGQQGGGAGQDDDEQRGGGGRAATPPPILVLVNPQDIVNIASAVRIARNFGIERMRLVDPAVFDPWRIEGIAHGSAEFVQRIEMFDTLEAAIADCVYGAVLTARARTAKRRTLRPRAAAAELVERSVEGPVALVFGREDRGLTNAELDAGHVLVTIPTDPRSTSLNLAQAVAVMAYETWLVRGGETQAIKRPRRDAGAAESAQLESLFADWRRALWAIDFFKTRRPDAVMRSLREIVYRAGLDGREATLMRAMGIEVVRFLERTGVPVAAEPPGAGDDR
jgi:TrmH family RNA methyltransferase